MRIKGVAMLAAILPALAPGAAQPGGGAVALTHVRPIDGNGGPPLEDATVVIRDGRIAAAGRQLRLPADVQVVDHRGRSVIPGLISDHSHVGLVGGTEDGAQNHNRANITAALAQYRRYGITTVVALGGNGPLFDELRREAHAGGLPADLFGVDQGIGVPDGAPPQGMMHLGPDQLYRPATAEEARQAVDRMVDAGTDLVKLWLDDFGGTVAGKMTPAIYGAVIGEAHRRGVRVAAHIHDLADAEAVVAAGADILAHGVRDRPVTPAFIATLKSKGVWVIPTLALDDATVAWADAAPWTQTPFAKAGLSPALAARIDDPAWRAGVRSGAQAEGARASLAMNLRNLRTLYDAGVKIGFGTDSGAVALRVPGVAEHRELQLMQQSGLTTLQALTVATRDAAALMGLTDRGVLTPGRRADLVILDGDPSHDPEALDRVVETWENGRPVPGPVQLSARAK